MKKSIDKMIIKKEKKERKLTLPLEAKSSPLANPVPTQRNFFFPVDVR